MSGLATAVMPANQSNFVTVARFYLSACPAPGAFPPKWTPVRGRKCDKHMNLERIPAPVEEQVIQYQWSAL